MCCESGFLNESEVVVQNRSQQHLQVIKEQTSWGQTVCSVWLPNQDAMVRGPRSALRPLNADLQPVQGPD